MLRYCGGDVDFVVKAAFLSRNISKDFAEVNANMNMPIAFSTPAFQANAAASLSETATRDIIDSRNEQNDPIYTLTCSAYSDFISWTSGDWALQNAGYLQHCGDWDQAVFTNSISFILGLGTGLTCRDLKQYCWEPHLKLLRLVCPQELDVSSLGGGAQECGCMRPLLSWYNLPEANDLIRVFQVGQGGCSRACLEISQQRSAHIPCRDVYLKSGLEQGSVQGMRPRP